MTRSSTEMTGFARGVVYNVASFAIMGVLGFAINALIARYYGDTGLGIFSQVFAFFIIASQLAAGGFVFAAMRFCAEHTADRDKISGIVWSGLIFVGIQGSIVSLLIWLASEPIGRLWGSPEIGHGVAWIAPGLLFFALSKCLLFSGNGLGLMGLFATGQALRFVYLFGALLILIWNDAPASTLPAIFTFAEILLFLTMLLYMLAAKVITLTGDLRHWAREHLAFGWRAALSGLFMDINTKVDILMLGLFVSDAEVGIYAFAALIIEGVLLLPVVIQNNMNARLTRLKSQGRQADAGQMVLKTLKFFTPLLLALIVLTTLLYPWAVEILTGDPAFSESVLYFAVLAVGVVLASPYLPFAMIFNQWGHPAMHTTFFALILIANIIFNAILIPIYGVLGAAVGTMLSYLALVIFIKVLVRRVEGVRI